MFGKKEIDLNLRSEPDFWVRSIDRLAFIDWCLLITAFVFAFLALPPVRIFINDNFDFKLSEKWSRLLFNIDLIILIVTFCLSLAGLFINSKRHRRRNDQYNTSLVFLTILSAIGIIGYAIFYIII